MVPLRRSSRWRARASWSTDAARMRRAWGSSSVTTRSRAASARRRHSTTSTGTRPGAIVPRSGWAATTRAVTFLPNRWRQLLAGDVVVEGVDEHRRDRFALGAVVLEHEGREAEHLGHRRDGGHRDRVRGVAVGRPLRGPQELVADLDLVRIRHASEGIDAARRARWIGHDLAMEPTLTRFDGFEGIHLVADVWGDPDAWPVLLMHGGGQTRHAWGGTARVARRERVAGGVARPARPRRQRVGAERRLLVHRVRRPTRSRWPTSWASRRCSWARRSAGWRR